MPVVLARVDDRLIHGQVTVGWSERLRPDRIVLANNAIAADPWQSRVYASSVPPSIAVSVVSLARAAAALRSAEAPAERVILLTGTPAEMSDLAHLGAPLPGVNLGGMHFGTGQGARCCRSSSWTARTWRRCGGCWPLGWRSVGPAGARRTGTLHRAAAARGHGGAPVTGLDPAAASGERRLGPGRLAGACWPGPWRWTTRRWPDLVRASRCRRLCSPGWSAGTPAPAWRSACLCSWR